MVIGAMAKGRQRPLSILFFSIYLTIMTVYNIKLCSGSDSIKRRLQRM